MEKEGYIYPQKIHRLKQVNFEPLEIHYKVHSYACKQLTNIMFQIKRRDIIFNSIQINNDLKVIYANLKRFSFHAIEQKGISLPEFYVENPLQLLNEEKLGSLTYSNKNHYIIIDEIHITDITEVVRIFLF